MNSTKVGIVHIGRKLRSIRIAGSLLMGAIGTVTATGGAVVATQAFTVQPAAASVCLGAPDCTNPNVPVPGYNISCAYEFVDVINYAVMANGSEIHMDYQPAQAYPWGCRTVWARINSGSFSSGTLMTRVNNVDSESGFSKDTLGLPLNGGNLWTDQLADYPQWAPTGTPGWYGYSCGYTSNVWRCTTPPY